MKKKKSKQRPPSAEERREKQQQSLQNKLLYDREGVAQMLSVSVATVCRWESIGRLKAIKPSGAIKGKTFYLAADVNKVATPSGEAA